MDQPQAQATQPKRTRIAVFRAGSVRVPVMMVGEGPEAAYFITPMKVVDQETLQLNPNLAHIYTPEESIALQSLLKEAQDCVTNHQSVLLAPLSSSTVGPPPSAPARKAQDQAQPTKHAPPAKKAVKKVAKKAAPKGRKR